MKHPDLAHARAVTGCHQPNGPDMTPVSESGDALSITLQTEGGSAYRGLGPVMWYKEKMSWNDTRLGMGCLREGQNLGKGGIKVIWGATRVGK